MKYILYILLCTISLNLSAKSQPNIIIIFTDDQGYQDLGCFGSPDIATPNIDKIADEGMRFTNFYVADPVCSPSRAALLTGKYPAKAGVRRVLFPDRGQGGLEPSQTTIADVLKSAGYATKAVGKWHLGDEPKYLPINNGFDSYYGIPYSNDMTPSRKMKYADDCLFHGEYSVDKLEAMFAENQAHSKSQAHLPKAQKTKGPHSLKDKVPLMLNAECIEFPADQRTITERYTNKGIEFIQQNAKAKKPFFLYLAHSMPHTPLFRTQAFANKSKEGIYGDVIEEIDSNVGRLMAELKKQKIDDNTIVVYTSDNGPWLIKGDHGGHALPLYEGKMTFFEGGMRVPCVMRWPGNIPGNTTCNELALTMDLLPTLAKFAGAKIPKGLDLDGKKIDKLLLGKKGAKTQHKYFFYRNAAVRSGDWKYHKFMEYKVKATARPNKGEALYNLKNDIGETKNLINEHPEIAAKLKKALEAHNEALGMK